MNITIASGKGGTGKTTFSVNLAYALAGRGEAVRLLDCDVEEPNDHLFVQPVLTERTAVDVMKPVWHESRCAGSGECAAACNYNAIALVKDTVLIFNELCHSCGVCSFVCPNQAFTESPVTIGVVEAAPGNDPFYFVHGKLNIAEALAPTVVRSVKQHIDPAAVNIIDAAPGTSCPVVEALADADVAVLVTEPTPFGLNDLKLAVALTLERRIPTGIVINCSDGSDEIITDYADAVGVPVVGTIPFKREYAECYSRGSVLAHDFPEFGQRLLRIYDNIVRLAGTKTPPAPAMEEFTVVGKTPDTLAGKEGGDYRETTIISGKGGSGKTTVVSSLAVLAENSVLADNDVDAADLHLLLEPVVREAHEFTGGDKAVIDMAACAACGECETACHFDAIHSLTAAGSNEAAEFRIDEYACEGCGLCTLVCEFGAVSSRPNVVGKWFISETGYGPMVHARLGIAEENSGKLVSKVRAAAAGLAKASGHGRIMGDGPPGTGCPVIASISGTDRVLIVTEPTVSGVHDMERVLKLTRHFNIPTAVVINKADLNPEQAERIDAIAQEADSRVIARIPFDPAVKDALRAGKTVVDHGSGPAYEAILRLWASLRNEL